MVEKSYKQAFGSLCSKYRGSLFKAEVGRRAGCTGSFITRLESGDRPPPHYDMCNALADAFGLKGSKKAQFIFAALMAKLEGKEELKYLEALKDYITFDKALEWKPF